jgi:DNA polymerase III delta prime subunit
MKDRVLELNASDERGIEVCMQHKTDKKTYYTKLKQNITDCMRIEMNITGTFPSDKLPIFFLKPNLDPQTLVFILR